MMVTVGAELWLQKGIWALYVVWREMKYITRLGCKAHFTFTNKGDLEGQSLSLHCCLSCVGIKGTILLSLSV